MKKCHHNLFLYQIMFLTHVNLNSLRLPCQEMLQSRHNVVLRNVGSVRENHCILWNRSEIRILGKIQFLHHQRPNYILNMVNFNSKKVPSFYPYRTLSVKAYRSCQVWADARSFSRGINNFKTSSLKQVNSNSVPRAIWFMLVSLYQSGANSV